ncbi:MAG: hypothetical protein QOE61_742, partial [Micromonosporaceae bacterium]|nr:hypothetical protein [Micromonosporaceae bacterium]
MTAAVAVSLGRPYVAGIGFR